VGVKQAGKLPTALQSRLVRPDDRAGRVAYRLALAPTERSAPGTNDAWFRFCGYEHRATLARPSHFDGLISRSGVIRSRITCASADRLELGRGVVVERVSVDPSRGSTKENVIDNALAATAGCAT
jgi:hypothetical protein